MRYVNEPTPGSLADLQDEADPEDVARTILLRRLTACARTRKECVDDLLKRGIPAEVADRVVERFVEVGLINDGDYARLWVQSRQRSKGSAASVLRRELRAKGVDDVLVSAAIEEIDPAVERDRARQLVETKLRAMARFDDATRQRRLVSMLMRRGYSHGVAAGVVREAMADDASDADLGLDESM